MKSILLTLIMLTATISSAAPGEAVLVPVFFGDTGAHGSIWRTRLTVRNDSDRSLTGIHLSLPCPIPEGCPIAFPPRFTWTAIATDGFRYELGFLLFPETEGAEVSYALRVYDESRSGANYGTDIPVVPLSDFSTRTMQLLDVPLDPASRLTLRIYAQPPAVPRVRVRTYDDPPLIEWFNDDSIPESRLLSETFYDLTRSQSFPDSGSFSRPSGTVVSDVLASVPESAPESVRVEIQTMDGSVPIWAFISVTNNDTQLVTAIVPRPTVP